MSEKIVERVRGALYGVAVGDALGMPVESWRAEDIQKSYYRLREMVWRHGQTPAGTVTDDTDLTLAVGLGIVESPDDPVPAVGEHFIEWARGRHLGAGRCCLTTSRDAMALGDRPTREQWLEISAAYDKQIENHSGGNGALMRSVYPGLYYNDVQRAVEVAADIAQMTHFDEGSTGVVRLYTRLIYALARGASLDEVAPLVDASPWAAKLGDDLPPSAGAVDSFRLSWAVVAATPEFEETVVTLVNLGGDTDTNAAIGGGLAGAVYGYGAIPERWIECLQPVIKAELDSLADAACAAN